MVRLPMRGSSYQRFGDLGPAERCCRSTQLWLHFTREEFQLVDVGHIDQHQI